MICSFYSHHVGFERIKDIVQTTYPKGSISISKEEESDILELDIKGGLFSASKRLKITYRQRIKPSYTIYETDDCPLINNLKGMYGFVNSLPCSNENVKNLFLQKILTLNCEFSIVQQQGEIKELKSLIQNLVHEFDAILFVQPGTLISKSDGQHFLDKNLNLIIDQHGNCEIDTLDVKIDSSYFDEEQVALTEDQLIRKTNSEKILHSRNIKVNNNLPCIESESETTIRQPKEIAQRVSVLAITNLVAFNHIPNEEAVAYLQKHDLWKFVTPDEKKFLANPTEEKKNQETWKCEAIWTLLWAINKVDSLPFPNELCNLGNIPSEDYPVGKNKSPIDFINSITTTRPKKEIVDTNDLYYRFDWACVDARINSRQITEIHPGVVYERHYALNWLINYMDQDWDDVSCDT